MTWLKHLEINYPEIYKRLNFRWLSENPNIRIKDVLEHPNWSWQYLSLNSGIQMQDIIDHPDLPWDWYAISKNPNITIEFVIKYKEQVNWYNVIRNAGIKLKDILNHLELPWAKLDIIWNPNVTINDILAHPEIKWSTAICSNRNMTFDFILGFDQIDWSYLSSNPAITLNDITTHLEYPWIWKCDLGNRRCISANPNMTIEFAIEHQAKLDWTVISCNPGITIDDIIDHPELPWSWFGISLNPNITPDFIMANFKHINFNNLSVNPSDRKNLTKKIVETTLGLSSVPTEYAHGRLPAHLVNEIIGHLYDTSTFTLHDMIKRIIPIIEYK